MNMINKYVYRSRISETKFRQIIKCFCADLTASQISDLSGMSRNSINKILKAIRTRIAEYCEQESPFEKGEIELDESYFGARRVRGKRGRGAHGKTIVFGMIKRQGKVYTQIVNSCSAKELLTIVKEKVPKESSIYTDTFRTYDGLVNMGYKKHYRIAHGKDEFAKNHNHINGIENFWGLAKVRLSKFRGMHKSTFYLHLKECEFRFNYRHDNLYKRLLNMLRNNPLKLS
jgi:transposase